MIIRMRTREKEEELVAMWFRALQVRHLGHLGHLSLHLFHSQNLMGKPTFTGGAPETSCSKAS